MKVKISNRLTAISRLIAPGAKVADIGTDHGLLPIFLLQNNLSPKVILSDIGEGPLGKARDNLRTYVLNTVPDVRLGPGLSTLQCGEVDTVVIAGMGGKTIIEILSQDIKKTNSFSKYILQPRNCQESLRIWLDDNSYHICNELLVREGKFICEIIVVDASFKTSKRDNKSFLKMHSNLEFEISPLLFAFKDPLLKDLIKCKIRTEDKIISSISESGSYRSLRIMPQRINRMQKLKRLYKQTHIHTL